MKKTATHCRKGVTVEAVAGCKRVVERAHETPRITANGFSVPKTARWSQQGILCNSRLDRFHRCIDRSAVVNAKKVYQLVGYRFAATGPAARMELFLLRPGINKVSVPAANPASDISLLAQARAGDAAALAALYRRHSGAVFRYATLVAPHRDAAADATQETFLWLATDGALRFDPSQGSLAAFLCGVVRHQTLRIRASDARQGAGVADMSSQDGERAVVDEASDRAVDDALSHLLARERGAAVLAALRELSTEQREIIALVEFEEFSYVETARILGCPIGTVRSRLHRAKHALQQRLLELFPAELRNTV